MYPNRNDTSRCRCQVGMEYRNKAFPNVDVLLYRAPPMEIRRGRERPGSRMHDQSVVNGSAACSGAPIVRRKDRGTRPQARSHWHQALGALITRDSRAPSTGARHVYPRRTNRTPIIPASRLTRLLQSAHVARLNVVKRHPGLCDSSPREPRQPSHASTDFPAVETQVCSNTSTTQRYSGTTGIHQGSQGEAP